MKITPFLFCVFLLFPGLNLYANEIEVLKGRNGAGVEYSFVLECCDKKMLGLSLAEAVSVSSSNLDEIKKSIERSCLDCIDVQVFSFEVKRVSVGKGERIWVVVANYSGVKDFVPIYDTMVFSVWGDVARKTKQ